MAAAAASAWGSALYSGSGRESVDALFNGMRSQRLVFGDRPICNVLAPLFIDAAHADRITHDATVLVSAFRKVRAVLEPGGKHQGVLRIPPAEEALLACDAQGVEPDQIARMDGFVGNDGIWRTIEYNAESPGGIAFGDALRKVFLDTPVGRAFSKQFSLRPFDGVDKTLQVLKAAYRRRLKLPLNAPCAPRIAVVDWPSAPTSREFELCADQFSRSGCVSWVCSPEDLRLDGDVLIDGTSGRAIDVVYKRVLVKDLVKHGGVDHPLARALVANKVSVVSGFGVHRLYRKEGYALLHHPDVQAMLSPVERETVDHCVPWSALYAPDGKIDPALLEVARRDRERLVLKPTDDYGGHGVVLGWLVSDTEWDAALTRALSSPHLLQTRVAIPSDTWPILDQGVLKTVRFHADINPYVWGGNSSDGFGARLAPGELLNVTAGGGSAVPVFVIETV